MPKNEGVKYHKFSAMLLAVLAFSHMCTYRYNCDSIEFDFRMRSVTDCRYGVMVVHAWLTWPVLDSMRPNMDQVGYF
jgi:hypothetical protein